jgi:sugar/nucleoside kinase (ribokinase family)
MGAGFASAFGGVLHSTLGPEDDPMSRAVAERLERFGIVHRPIRMVGKTADWTLLVTSGAFGDKLPIGFRGCHASLSPPLSGMDAPCDLRVVAALPNPLAEPLLRAPGAEVRFFAPSMRNVIDRTRPVSRFADAIDVLSCNRHEWESLEDREQVAWQVSLLAITDGSRGSRVQFTTETGEPGWVEIPAFPREEPPRDTNRAGEAYAATLLSTLLDEGWRPGVTSESLVKHAAERASAAAALVLDRVAFGFPTPAEVDDVLRQGKVGSEPRDGRDDLR